MRALSICAVVLVLLAVGPPLLADAPQTGVVQGTVKALGASPLPGVEVSLEGERGTTTAVTDAEGNFRFPAVLSGRYTVTAKMEGLQPASQAVAVESGGRSDVVLDLADVVSQEIVVTAETPLVSKYDTSAGGTLSATELGLITGDMRASYRSYLSMLPGVFNPDDAQTGNRPSVQGTEGARQVYFVDGVDVSFARWGGGSQLNVPTDAVQQLTLKSTGADAEYSRTVGAYANATIKSGTNKYHGSAQWMAQNLSWNAENRKVVEERPDQRADSWQGTFGGRIVRDKLWFFAAAKRDDNPAYSVMADGVSVVDQGSIQESRLLKLDLQASDSHSLAVTYVETPWFFPWWADNTYGDIYTVAQFEYPGDLLSGRWSWTATDTLLVEANVGTTEPKQNRAVYVPSNVEPGCAPNQPCGNAWVYRPFDGTTLFYNGVGLPLGHGYTNFPRDQVNGSANWFSANHDIKVGIDYQELSWDLGGVSPPFCRGRGYNPTAPGGYNSNVAGTVAWCRFFPTKATWTDGYGPISFAQDNGAVFARDRISIDRWTLNLGLRVDQQNHHNDQGAEVLSSTDLVPRVSAVYDTFDDGKLLLSVTGGRYISHVEQAWSSNFNLEPSGRDQYEQYNFNRATGDYDIRTVVIGAGGGLDISPVDPPYKDEYTIGSEWQFHPDWAFKVRGIYWERQGAPQILTQIDTAGVVTNQVEDTDSTSKHKALSLELQRRFKNNWMVAASYDLSETKGDCWYGDNGGCISALGELNLWTNADGVPMSRVNRYGRLREDRPNMLKLRGAYRFDLAHNNSINIGGFLSMISGYPWNRVEEQTIPDALDPRNTNQTVTVFLEPRGSQRTPTQTQINMNLGWNFPVKGQVSGDFRVDVLNLTDEQELIGIGGLPTTGVALIQSGNFQNPRRIRGMVTFRF